MSENKNSNREKALLKNTLILSLGTFVPKAVSFVTLPILTASLSKEEYGTYDLILVLVSLVLPAATLQIQTAAFRFLIKYRNCREKQESIITNIFVFSSVVSVVALIVMFFSLGDLHMPPGCKRIGREFIICNRSNCWICWKDCIDCCWCALASGGVEGRSIGTNCCNLIFRTVYSCQIKIV